MNTERLRLLILDDEEGHIELIRRAFDEAGGKVDIRAVGTLREYRELVAAEPPDIALVDLNLPDGRGVDLLTHPPQDAPFPVLVMTAYGNQQIVVEVMKAGALDYVIKSPEAFAAMPHTVESAQREWALLQKHKQVAAELAVSHSLTESIVENIPLMVFLKEAKDLRFVIFNRAGEELLGYDRKALLGKNNLDLFPPEQAANFMARDREVLDGEAGMLDIPEEPIQTVKKGQRLLHTRKVCIRGADGTTKFLLGISEDITERRRAESALKDSEAKYRVLYESSQDALMTLFPPAWLFTSCNNATLRLFGAKDEAQFTSAGPWAVSPEHQPDGELSSAKAKRMIETAMEKGSHSFEWTHKKIGGAYFPAAVLLTRVEFGGKEGLQAIVRDITERKKADADIREAYEMQGMLNAMLQRSLTSLPLEKKLAGHLAALLSIPWLKVQPKGAIFLATGQMLTLTVQQGLAPELLVSCAQVPFGKCLCGRAAESGKVVAATQVGPEHETVYEGMLPHGHYCAPIIAAGATLGVLDLFLKEGTVLTAKQTVFVQAVTDNLAADILRARVESQVIQAQKLEAVGLLAGGVAHDFNNLLTAITCYGGFLMKELAADDPKRGDVKEILTAADRAAALTAQLLTFSRKQILSLEIVDLNASVGGMVKMLTLLIGEDIRLETRLAARTCQVSVDPGQMDQVIVNLVVNARDAMPKGGTLVLETAIITSGEGFFSKHAELPRGPQVCLSISDTGHGMTNEVKEHIFEPFFTTKNKGKGTGLGLSTVFGIVKQSGGDIEVESEPGRGATFRIYLPQAEADISDKDKDKGQGGVLKGTETVLFVEDDDTLRRLSERLLRETGYTVISAAGGKEALVAAERHGRPVDLLLTDVMMPGMSGRELALELARRKLAHRTLYMSGYTDDAIVRHGVLEPGIAFIHKPFTIEALSARLREVLDGPADQAKA